MVAFLCVGAKPLETKKKKYREGEAICLPLTAIINSTSQQLSRSDLSLSLSLSLSLFFQQAANSNKKRVRVQTSNNKKRREDCDLLSNETVTTA
jgi:hypothetical protein